MAFSNLFRRVSQSPTNPEPVRQPARTFDVADLYEGPLDTSEVSTSSASTAPLDEKLRQAYFWIVNSAIISPHYDIEYNEAPPAQFTVGDARARLTLPSAQSYSSFVLLPLLTFVARRKCLFVGGPGGNRRKTGEKTGEKGQTLIPDISLSNVAALGRLPVRSSLT